MKEYFKWSLLLITVGMAIKEEMEEDKFSALGLRQENYFVDLEVR